MAFRREVNAVGVRLEDRAAVFGELVDELLQKFAPAPRDLGRQLAIAEARAGESEVAIERVDQNLVVRLAGLGLGALLSGRRRAGELLEPQAGIRAASAAMG